MKLAEILNNALRHKFHTVFDRTTNYLLTWSPISLKSSLVLFLGSESPPDIVETDSRELCDALFVWSKDRHVRVEQGYWFLPRAFGNQQYKVWMCISLLLHNNFFGQRLSSAGGTCFSIYALNKCAQLKTLHTRNIDITNSNWQNPCILESKTYT